MVRFSRWYSMLAATAAALLLAAALPGTVAAAEVFKAGKVTDYQFPAPFGCNPTSLQLFVDEEVDNACGKGISTLFGNWVKTFRPTAYKQANRYISRMNQTGKEWVTWSPAITVAGQYEVWVDWRASENRAQSVPYYVYSDQGKYKFSVNQFIPDHTYMGMKWARLRPGDGDKATFYFAKRAASARPTNGYVKSINGPDHSESIDAIALRYVGPRLTASTNSPLAATLTWTAAPKNRNYQIYRGTSMNRAAATRRATVSGVTSWKDTAATCGVNYSYWVKAVRTDGKVHWSTRAVGKDAGPALTATTDQVNQVSLGWETVPNNTTFDVYRGTTTDKNAAVEIATVSTTAYTDTDTAPGVTYYYWVEAVQRSMWSNMAAGNDIGPGLTATNNLTDRITLNWDAVPNNTNYEVYRGTTVNVADATLVPGATVTVTTYDDTDAALVAGTSYNYWVKATQSDASVMWSSMATGLIPSPGDAPAE